MFTWRSLYAEIATRLLTFENRQSELIDLMVEMDARGLNVTPFTDQATEGTKTRLREIDPFTFFTIFNRSIKQQNRLKGLQFIKERWQLQAPLPQDFHGLPTISALNAWFFPWEFLRKSDDIPMLWSLARELVNGGWAAVSPQTFDRCLAIHQVGVGKLTSGMFWIAPSGCLPLPATTVEYLEAKNIPVDVFDWQSMDTLLQRVRAELSSDFVQESHNAWLHCANADAPKFAISDEIANKVWTAFLRSYPEFKSFSYPGEKFAAHEIEYKRNGLKKLEQSGGRAEVQRLLDGGDPSAALQLLIKTVSLNIASFQSWRPSIGLDQPEVLADVLRGFLSATEGPYEDADTLQPIFDALNRHGLKPAWDTLSVLLWGLRPTDYFPIKISYYRELAEKLGWELPSKRPTATSMDQLIRFGRAFWEIAKPKEPRDWVDVQSFLWAVCGAYGSEPVEPVPVPKAKQVWVIAPGENARLWDEFHAQGMVAIGWDMLGDLRLYKSKQEIAKELQAHDDRSSRSNDALCCWEFAREMQVGDLVIAKKGLSRIVGLGRVTSEYSYQPARDEYHSVRSVDWLRVGEWETKEPFTMKTLTNLTPYPDFVRGVLSTLDRPALGDELFGSYTQPDMPKVLTAEEVKKAKAFDRGVALARMFMSESSFDGMLAQLRRKKNIILQGPPGVGKTFIARTLAYALMEEEDSSRVKMVQFHQSYGYEDFIQGLRPTANGTYVLRDGVFYSFCEQAEADSRPWVFIIDEINRGNLSKILGELMMLIEADKRDKQYAMPLAYSDPSTEGFYVPPNVYLIGLMNTADRSLALVDYALRRRFAFVSLKPEFASGKFRSALIDAAVPAEVVDVLVQSLTALNDDIRKDGSDLGEGFCIGHSYFCPGDRVGDHRAWLSGVLDFEIKPLLQEYWMERADAADEAIVQIKKKLFP